MVKQKELTMDEKVAIVCGHLNKAADKKAVQEITPEVATKTNKKLIKESQVSTN
jgi:hypothetical protein